MFARRKEIWIDTALIEGKCHEHVTMSKKLLCRMKNDQEIILRQSAKYTKKKHKI